MVTIKDVAERAGVNPSTVSRALKDSSLISSKTKEAVKKAMEELGYVPNVAAKMLASGLTHSIGLIFPPMSNKEMESQPFYMEFLAEVNRVAGSKNYTLTIVTGDDFQGLKKQIRQIYMERRVDGFILLYSLQNDSVQSYLLDHKIPFVMLGTPVQYENETSFVDNDNKLMARTAVNYLHQQGHRQILFVTDNLNGEVQMERFRGYRLGMESLGLEAGFIQVFSGTDPDALEELAETIKVKKITALVIIDDILSLRLSQFLLGKGFKLPEDISLISFNNSVYTKILHPYLTTFDINIEMLGRASFTRVYDKIQSGSDSNAKIIIPFELKERESVRKLNQ